MTERNSYGTATVRITYSVQPPDGLSFDVIRETKVKMSQLPQAGQQVKISYNPDKHEKFEVLTPPGEETGTPTNPTAQTDWVDGPSRRRLYRSAYPEDNIRLK